VVKRRVIWSSRAKLDLKEILDFYFKRNGTKTFSNKLNSSFRKSTKLLEEHADIGLHTDILNMRNLIEGDYSIIYEIRLRTIKIHGLWDNRQNPENLHIKS
jgi:plasmid stabilization system protein ParE